MSRKYEWNPSWKWILEWNVGVLLGPISIKDEYCGWQCTKHEADVGFLHRRRIQYVIITKG